MRFPSFLIACTLVTAAPNAVPAQTSPALTVTTIIQNLHVPWEITWGPDNWIWFTERNGRISRVNPANGQRNVLLTLSTVWEQGESGMLGMALHPAFDDTPHVFVAYTYQQGGQSFERIERYTYTGSALNSPRVLLDSLDAGSIHNGCRLLILPDRTLLMTSGNAAGDNDPASPSLDTSRLEGKLLRMNLDGSVPADNPFPGSLIYTYGHRNPQGLLRLPDGNIFVSEHGPSTDDEINRIVKGGNYGWPVVRGLCDQASEIEYCDTMPVAEPLKSWTPTIAPAGIDFYNHSAIQGWQNSLILTTLKEEDLRILTLNATHSAIVSETILFNNQFGRLRDVCISPAGDVYLAVSNNDGRGTPMNGDDRIIRISPAASPVEANGVSLLATAGISVQVRGSFLRLLGAGNTGGTLALYSISGKLVKTFFLSGGFAQAAGAIAEGTYCYRFWPANGPILNGTVFIPGT